MAAKLGSHSSAATSATSSPSLGSLGVIEKQDADHEGNGFAVTLTSETSQIVEPSSRLRHRAEPDCAKQNAIGQDSTNYHSEETLLHQPVSAREQGVQSSHAEMTLLADELPNLSSTIDCLQRELLIRKDEIAMLEAFIAENTTRVAYLGQENSRLNQAFGNARKERDERQSALDHALKERDERQSALDHQAAERDDRHSALDHALKERDERQSALDHALKERDERQSALDHQAAELTVMRERVTQAETVSAGLQRQLIALVHSASWRITKPLRWSSSAMIGLKSYAGWLLKRFGRRIKVLPFFGRLVALGVVFVNARRIRAVGLFDRNWYLERYPDVRAAGVDPLLNYLRDGAARNRDPNPLFDTDWYLQQNPDVEDAGTNPLVHYLRFGAVEGRAPGPGFDGGLYLEQNPDVCAAGINPLAHYLRYGAAEGRALSSLMQAGCDVSSPAGFKDLKEQIAVIQESQLFDTVWYFAQYPEVTASGMDPIRHYVLVGAALGFDPCRAFSSTGYLKNNPDVAAAKANPFYHYVKYGRYEGRHGQPNDYQSWLAAYDFLTDSERAIFRNVLAEFTHLPLISIIMPVYNTEAEWLRRSIESVRGQIYQKWELCISENASTSPHIKEILSEYARTDERIRVAYRERNSHICGESNSALDLAQGEFIALLDSNDELTEHALFWVVNEIQQYPNKVDLIYSDEDKIDIGGHRYDAYFKPDWNPAFIQSQNFFSHLGVYRRSLVEKVGRFRVGFEGSQDHDLVLRCADETSAERIRHIPRVLYHLRAIPGSAASQEGIDVKPHAWQAAATAIEQHLQRRRVRGTVIRKLARYYQVTYSLCGPPPKVSIIMPSACNLNVLRPCLDSLFAKTSYSDFELLLVVSSVRFQNEAQAAFLNTLKDNAHVRVLVYDDRPYNFSWLNNWAAAQATGSVLCFLNDDVEVITPDWLEKLVTRVQLEGVGAVGPMLYYPNGTIQHAGVILGICSVAGHVFVGNRKGEGGYFGRAALEQDLSCVTAACAVVRRNVFDELDGFNEDLATAFNDVDFCIRLRRAGWRIIWTPEVEMYHHESASLGRHNSGKNRDRFTREVKLMRKLWGDALDNDPFYNPNLATFSTQFTLAFPPRIAKLPQQRVNNALKPHVGRGML